MSSAGVAFIISVGTALRSLLKARPNKEDRGWEKDRRQHSAAWPEDLPRVEPKQFVLRWSRTLTRKLALARRKRPAPINSALTADSASKPLSLRIAAAINFLYWPFFYSGIALCFWFAADSVLQLSLSDSAYQPIATISDPILTIATPAAVGFWTNWLAVKMLFHPRGRNAVWWGLVPARRNQLIDGIATGVTKQLISPQIVQEHLHKSGVVQRFVNDAAEALKDVLEIPRFRSQLKGLVYGLVYDFATSPDTRQSVEHLVRGKIRDWTGDTLSEKIAEWTKGLWGPMVLNEVLQALPELPKATDGVLSHVEKALSEVPGLMEKENSRIESLITKAIVEALHNLDIKQVVKAQLSKMDERALERMLTGNVTTELTFIQTSGGVFGLLAGLAFIYPASRPFLLASGLGLWLMYRLTIKNEAHS